MELLGGEIKYLPSRPGEPDCTHADISKSFRQLAWTPKVSFEEGILKMLDEIDHWADAPLWNEDSISEATALWFRYIGKKSGA